MPEAPDFTTKQSDWVENIVGSAEASEGARSHAAARGKGADLVEQKLDTMRDEIRKGQSYEIEKLPKNMLQALGAKLGMVSKMSSIDGGGDPMKEVDSWHDLPGSKAMSADEVGKVMESMQKIIGIQEEMKAITDDQGKHVYQPDPTMAKIEAAHKTEMDRIKGLDDPEEQAKALAAEREKLAEAKSKHEAALPDCERRLAEDLWQPLMREGIIPENAIPDKFSEVSRTFTAAAEAYNERLQDYSAELDTPQDIYNKLDPVLSVGESLLKSASAFAGMSAAIDKDVAGQAKEVKKTLDLVKLCVSSVHTGAEKALSARDAYGVVDAMNQMLVAVLTAEIGKDTAKLIGNIITASARGVKMADHLRLGEFDKALEAVGDAVGAGMATSGDSAVKDAGVYLKAGFQALAGTVRGIDSGSPKEVVKGAIAATRTIGEKHAKEAAAALRTELQARNQEDDSRSQKKRDLLDAQIGNPDKVTIKGLDKVEKAIGGKLDEKTIAEMIAANVDDKAIEALEEKAQKAQAEEMLDYAMRPDDEFEQMLANGFSAPANDDEAELQDLEKKANDIQRLIAIQKKDQAAFDLAKNISSGGLTFLQSLLPAAGIAVVANQLLFSIMEAVKHARQLEIWKANLADAQSAKTVQVDAMLNRTGLESSQTTQANIHVGLQAIALIGKVLELAAATGVGGPVGAIGTAMATGAQGTEALMDAAVKVKTEIQMHQAWKIYKKALETPQDRKLVRESLRTNPTLSKYAIAYGACIDKNPIAQKAMARCGLNAQTLSDPNANVGAVVTYLETLYKEDPVLLRAVPVPKAWYPGTPALTVASFGAFQLAAIKEVDLAKQDVSKIYSTLAVLEKVQEPAAEQMETSYTPQPQHRTAELDALATAAGDVMVAVSRYDPVDADGAAHDEMIEYRDALHAKAEILRTDAQDVIAAVLSERTEAADVA